MSTPIPVTVGTPIVFVGNSITHQGYYSAAASLVGGTNLLVDQLSPVTVAPRYASTSGSLSTSAGASLSTVAAVSGGGQVYAIASGVDGNKIADIEAAVASRITDHDPRVVVLEAGTNDVRGLGTSIPTPIVDFRASYDSVLDDVLAFDPTIAIVCVGILCIQEHWTASGGVHFTGNPYDQGSTTPCIEDYNAEILASATAHGCVYADVRAAAATAESVQNTPAPGAIDGVLTGAADGIHPSAAGQLVMSTALYPLFAFTP